MSKIAFDGPSPQQKMALFRRARRIAWMSDVRARRETQHSDIASFIVWGPVPSRVSEAYHFPAAVASVVLRPALDDGLLARVRALVPEAVRQQPDDSVASLCRRLRKSHFLEDAHVKAGGSGRKNAPDYVQLNGSAYPQPRRVTWVAPEGGAFDDAEHGCVFRACYYNSTQRLPQDWKAFPMPWDIFDLGRVPLPRISNREVRCGGAEMWSESSLGLTGLHISSTALSSYIGASHAVVAQSLPASRLPFSLQG